MKKLGSIGLRYLLPLALAVFLMWWITKDITEEQQSYIIQSIKEADYFWIGLSLIAAIVSHWVRALRWQMLLRPLGYSPTTLNTFWAVMVAYIANLVLPRVGEVSRCVVLKKTDKVPISQSIGTVVTERLLDLVAFGLIFVLTFMLNANFISYLFGSSGSDVNVGTKIGGLVVLLSAGLVIYKFVFPRIKKYPLIQKLLGFFGNLKKGFMSVFKLKNPLLFISYTFLIWFLYYLMMVFMVKALGATSHLGFNGALLILTIGTFGFIAPVQGGFGAYHGAIIWLLTSLNKYSIENGLDIASEITQGDAISFAFLAHSAQTLLVVIMGLIALFFVFILKPKNDLEGGTS